MSIDVRAVLRAVVAPLAKVILPAAAFTLAASTLLFDDKALQRFGNAVLTEDQAPVSLWALTSMISVLLGAALALMREDPWSEESWPWRMVQGARSAITGWVYALVAMGIALAIIVPFVPGKPVERGVASGAALLYALGLLYMFDWMESKVSAFARARHDPADAASRSRVNVAIVMCFAVAAVSGLGCRSSLKAIERQERSSPAAADTARARSNSRSTLPSDRPRIPSREQR